MLAPGERVKRAYQLIRDQFVFTDKRLILVDRQGMTGKVEYRSLPYRAITIEQRPRGPRRLKPPGVRKRVACWPRRSHSASSGSNLCDAPQSGVNS